MKKLILSFLLVSLTTNILFATHNQAGEIIFKQINGLTIEASIITYTKLSSVAADRDSLNICWGNGNCETIGRTNGNGNGVPIGQDTKKNIYVATHTYSGGGNYVISMTDPNRNGGIINVDWPNSENTPFILETAFTFPNPILTGPNNSPILLQPPIDIAFTGEPFLHTPNAFDIDGDSIAYELVTPLGVFSYGELTEVAPGPDNNLTMNEETGLLVWDSPQAMGTYTIAYKVKSYRNGGLIDYIIRDMQIEVEEGPGFAPEIVMENVTGNEEIILVDLGDTVTMNITVSDPDPNQQLEISATCGLFDYFNSNAFFSASASGNTGSGTFTWVVQEEHLRKEPYQLVFKVEDNTDTHFKSSLAVIRYQTSTTTDVEELTLVSEPMLFPNPVHEDYLNFYFKEGFVNYKSYKVLNLLGQEVKQGVIEADLTEVSTKGLPKGTYLFRIDDGISPIVMTFIVL